MAQLSEERMNRLWPNRSSKVTFLVHCMNRSREMKRLLESVKGFDRIIVLVDDRTTDDMPEVAKSYGAEIEYFTWRDDFSYPKNILTKKVPHGEWCLVMGSDFELLPETYETIRAFTEDPRNCLAKFNVKEYVEDPTLARQRMRVLLWRSHERAYWEKLVHEEVKSSYFRLCYLGIEFRKDWGIPCIGDMLHYGDFENTPEQLEGKRDYYGDLWERDIHMRRAQLDGNFGHLYSLAKFYKKFSTVDEVIEFMDASLVPGFSPAPYYQGLRIHSKEEITAAMNANKVPTATILLDQNYD